MPRRSTPPRRRRRAADGERTSIQVYVGCSTMKDLSLDDRPREKLWHHGASALGDNELVALIIAHGGRHGSALELANALLATYDGLHGLTRCSGDDLARVAGIGQSRAAQILAALGLGRRTLAHAPARVGGSADGHRPGGPRHPRRRAVLQLQGIGTTLVERLR